MAPSRRILIPKIFNYLLPAQGIVAAVVIYSSIYIFGVGKIPFILAVAAVGIPTQPSTPSNPNLQRGYSRPAYTFF